MVPRQGVERIRPGHRPDRADRPPGDWRRHPARRQAQQHAGAKDHHVAGLGPFPIAEIGHHVLAAALSYSLLSHCRSPFEHAESSTCWQGRRAPGSAY